MLTIAVGNLIRTFHGAKYSEFKEETNSDYTAISK